MTTTCSRVEIIQHMFNLLMGEASPDNIINPTSIQGIIHDEIVFHVVTDMTTIVMGYIWMKYFYLEIDKQISIPWIGSANQEKKFIKK